jgi:RNA:NAD 2'-phosphotransferase (TPT1/KptA family)
MSLIIQSINEAHWFDATRDDNYVYHGTQKKNIEGIKREGITGFRRTYFSSDPKVSMRYGYRPNLHHPSDAKKLSGVLLRVHKKHVDPEGYRRGMRSDFWTGQDIPPEHVEVHQGGGKWKPLRDYNV